MLHVVIVLDPNDGAYVWSEYACLSEANLSSYEAKHDTGYKVLVKSINLNTNKES